MVTPRNGGTTKHLALTDLLVAARWWLRMATAVAIADPPAGRRRGGLQTPPRITVGEHDGLHHVLATQPRVARSQDTSEPLVVPPAAA